MGNEQSTPVAAAGALAAEATARGTPRNKLSKPRTNSFANANGVPTNGKTSASPSRRGSVSGNGGLLNNRFSMVSIDVGEVADSLEGKGKVNTKEEPVKKKRMSIFRSRSSKAKVPQSEVNNEVATSPEDKSPVKKIWRRSNSVTENGGQKGVRDNIPVERYDSSHYLESLSPRLQDTDFRIVVGHLQEPLECHFNTSHIPNIMLVYPSFRKHLLPNPTQIDNFGYKMVIRKCRRHYLQGRTLIRTYMLL